MSQHHHRTPIVRSSRLLLGGLAITWIVAGSTLADGGRKSKPIRPSASIDNEGPVIALPETRNVPGDGDARQFSQPPAFLFPWRPPIRLDLILPIRDPTPWTRRSRRR